MQQHPPANSLIWRCAYGAKGDQNDSVGFCYPINHCRGLRRGGAGTGGILRGRLHHFYSCRFRRRIHRDLDRWTGRFAGDICHHRWRQILPHRLVCDRIGVVRRPSCVIHTTPSSALEIYAIMKGLTKAFFDSTPSQFLQK